MQLSYESLVTCHPREKLLFSFTRREHEYATLVRCIRAYTGRRPSHSSNCSRAINRSAIEDTFSGSPFQIFVLSISFYSLQSKKNDRLVAERK